MSDQPLSRSGRPGTAADPTAPAATARDGADPGRLVRLLAAVATGLHAELDAATETAAGCTATGPALLVSALHHPGAPTHELAGAVGLSRSGTVRSLDRLEAAGLVLRRDAPDHRSSLVLLTPAGAAAARRVLHARYAVVARVLAGLPATAGEALLPALELVAANLAGRGEVFDAQCDRPGCCPPIQGVGPDRRESQWPVSLETTVPRQESLPVRASTASADDIA